jgi:hypothetical protein
MMKKLLVLMLVLGIASTANALVVSFSSDGSTPLADGATVNLATGSTTTLYFVSDTSGIPGAYWTYFEMTLPNTDASVPFASVSAHANAGDTRDVQDHSGASLMDYLLVAADSAGGIVAGQHFAFDVQISGSAATDGSDDFALWNTVPSDSMYPVDKTVNIHIVPEPATMALLGLGGLFLLRRRKR